jgi:hypothetical protein
MEVFNFCILLTRATVTLRGGSGRPCLRVIEPNPANAPRRAEQNACSPQETPRRRSHSRAKIASHDTLRVAFEGSLGAGERIAGPLVVRRAGSTAWRRESSAQTKVVEGLANARATLPGGSGGSVEQSRDPMDKNRMISSRMNCAESFVMLVACEAVHAANSGGIMVRPLASSPRPGYDGLSLPPAPTPRRSRSAIRPLSRASGVGGHPGMVRFTGMTEETAPTQA